MMSVDETPTGPAPGILTPPPVLASERLLIRPLVATDLEDCHRLYLDIGWALKGLDVEQNRERRRSWLDWTIASYREFPRLQQPPYGERAVVLRDGGAFLGLVGLVPSLGPFAQLPSLGGHRGARFSPEFGLFWALTPVARGKGLATEAARVFLDHVVSLLNPARVVATTDRGNHRSIAVMQRLGMRVEENPWPVPDWFQVVGIYEPTAPLAGPVYRPARDRMRDG